MRRVSASELCQSMVLGKSLYDGYGQVLLAAGVMLTERLIDGIRNRGFPAVYIRDGQADDVPPADLLTEQVRVASTTHLNALFSIAGRPRESAPSQPGHWPVETWRVVENLYRDVDAIMDEVFSTDALIGMATLKSHDNYTFEHSVETAVVGVMLGKRLGMQRSDHRQLGLGCLVHDLGKSYTELDILNKPGPLTAEEFNHIREHPRAGYDLVTSLDLESTVPQHVAWQHHEMQDGNGYPRGLHGTNRVVRTRTDLATPGRIMLLAELTSVADFYSALASDRPYRPALPPDEVASTIWSMAGHHLNREVVETFFRVVPTYPVGLRVIVSGGEFDGWRGVVAAVQSPHLHRPIVRLFQDARGRPISGDEINLARLPDLQIASESLEQEAAA